MKKVEEKRLDVNSAVGMGELILSVCHPDCVTTIKHWITIIRARFEEVSHHLCLGTIRPLNSWAKRFNNLMKRIGLEPSIARDSL